MNEQKKKNIALFDMSKHGTMIIGHTRCGSHFVQELIVNQIATATQAGRISARPVIAHGEWQNDKVPTQIKLFKLERDPAYHVIVVNRLDIKSDLLNQHDLRDWHVVRLTHEDKYKWFISWYFFCYAAYFDRSNDSVIIRLDNQYVRCHRIDDHEHYYDVTDLTYISSKAPDRGRYRDDTMIGTVLYQQKPGVHHRSGPVGYYTEMLTRIQQEPLSAIVFAITECMNNHIVNQMIPADLEIEYSTLASLGNADVQWTPNHYPDIDLNRLFDRGDIVKQLLDRWSGPWPGVFKEA